MSTFRHVTKEHANAVAMNGKTLGETEHICIYSGTLMVLIKIGKRFN